MAGTEFGNPVVKVDREAASPGYQLHVTCLTPLAPWSRACLYLLLPNSTRIALTELTRGTWGRGNPEVSILSPLVYGVVSNVKKVDLILNTTDLPIGAYALDFRVSGVGSALANFTLDSLKIRAGFSQEGSMTRIEINVTSALSGEPVGALLSVTINPGNLSWDLSAGEDGLATLEVNLTPGVYEVLVEASLGAMRGSSEFNLVVGPSIEVGRTLYSPDDLIEIRLTGFLEKPSLSLVTPLNTSIDLTFLLNRTEFGVWTVKLNLTELLSPIPLGEYEVIAQAGSFTTSTEFNVTALEISVRGRCSCDKCRIEVNVVDALTGGPVNASTHAFVAGPNGYVLTLEERLDGRGGVLSFTPWVAGQYFVSLSVIDDRGIHGEASLGLAVPSKNATLVIVSDRLAYSPGDTAVLSIVAYPHAQSLEVHLLLPSGRQVSLPLEKVNETAWTAKLPLLKNIELGEYRAVAEALIDGLSVVNETTFYVDVLELNASYEDGLIEVTVSGIALGPLDGANVTVSLRELNLSFFCVTEGGSCVFKPDLPPGNYTADISASWLGLSCSAVLEFSMHLPPGGELRIDAPASLTFGAPEEVSVPVEVTLDGLPVNATLQYRLLASNGTEVAGGEFEVPGSAVISLGCLDPGEYALKLTASLGDLRAEAEVLLNVVPYAPPKEETELANLSITVEGAALAGVARIESVLASQIHPRGLVLLEVNLTGDAGFEAELAIRSSYTDLEALLLDPSTLSPLRATGLRFGEHEVEIHVLDGGQNDIDGSENGFVRLAVCLLTPEQPPTLLGLSAPPKALPSPEELAVAQRVAEFEAVGSNRSWRVILLDVKTPGFFALGDVGGEAYVLCEGTRKPVGPKGVKLNTTGLVVIEADVGPSPEPSLPPKANVVSPGKILVELVDKQEGVWRRVEVSLPPGAVVEKILAVGANKTREVTTWVQTGSKVVFYDDPNQYYYILYGVPPWWDPDGPNSGYDWHYRVPITVPAALRGHMITVRINFGDLLQALDVSGTFDNNSVRVVDDSGDLAPRQEYIPMGEAYGEVRFLLEEDLASDATYYIYFDILENGAKPALNALNTGLDSGTLDYWTCGRDPSTIASIIEASPPGPYVIDGGTTGYPAPSPRYITDDGQPVAGGYSLVLGYRTNQSEDYTSTGEDTWAYYEFYVPQDGGNLYFWYRVESWDSSSYDYLEVTLRDTTNAVLATLISAYNPNPGTSYGTFADSGWLSFSYDLSAYSGTTVRVYFRLHTFSDDWYKTWAYIDHITWANLTATVQDSMVEGFGVNVTEPLEVQTYGPLSVAAVVDASPTGGIVARIYDASGTLRATAPLYDDGTHGDPTPNDGVFVNSNAYTIQPGDPLGVWRVVVLANDSSTSLYDPSYDGLIHIPGRPYEVNYTDFFNVGERTFEVRANLTGVIFEDAWPLATGYDLGADLPISGARVALFLDDGDGQLDPYYDVLVDVESTTPSGGYSFLAENHTYLIAVESRTLTSQRGLNAGHSWAETWAEETYHVEWDGAAHSGRQAFGGRDPEVSDSCTLGLIFYDGFETWSGWLQYGSGEVYQSAEQAYEGSYSLKKDSNNDPNGGYKPIGQTISRGYILQGYVYRPGAWSGGSIDRIGLEDSSFNGYTFAVNHRFNWIWIDRRDSGVPTRISPRVAWDPPEDAWYFWKLIFFENGTIAFQVYDLNGNLQVEVRATDTTYTSFDRIVVHGGYEYYVDELRLWRPGQPCEHFGLVSVGDYLGESLDFGFSFDVVVNTLDMDHDPLADRFAQGTLRQFIQNANAIQGPDRSWFVMMVSQNVAPDPSHSWWRIAVNSTLGALSIADADTTLNGTVFTPALAVVDSNPGLVGTGGSVGTGRDGAPETGDEPQLPRYSRPEVELNLTGSGSVGIEITGSSVVLANLSLFGDASTTQTLISITGSGAVLHGLLAGVFADGSYPGSPSASTQIVLVDATDVLIDACYIGYSSWGIIRNGGDNFTIRVCELFSANMGTSKSSEAIDLLSGTHIRIEGNLVRDCDAAPGLDGGAVELLRNVRNVFFVNNTVINSQGYGLMVSRGARDVLVKHNVFYNNLVGVIVSNWVSPAYNVTISENSIYDNTRLGIDLTDTAAVGTGAKGDNVTLNDGILNPLEPNYGIDYPVLTGAFYNGTHLYVQGFINDESAGSGSSNFAGAVVEVYLVNNSSDGDDLLGNNYSGDTPLSQYYGEGWVYLGRLTADANGEFEGWIDVSSLPASLRPERDSLVTATSWLSGNGTSEFGPDVRVRTSLLNVQVRKSVTPAASACYYEVRLNVTNNSPSPAPGVRVYDVVPDGMVLESAVPPYSGSSGNVYWWVVDLGPFGTPDASREIVYTLRSAACGISDYRLSDAFIVGIDPAGYLNITATEFAELTFYPNGTYVVSELWGFLTVSNPTSDVISDITLAVNGTGYVFYPEYPTPSNTPVQPPFMIPELRPGEYVRWRYVADPEFTEIPLRVVESLDYVPQACGLPTNITLRISLVVEDDLTELTLIKPIPNWLEVRSVDIDAGSAAVGEYLNWTIGEVRALSRLNLFLRGEAEISGSTRLPSASLTFRRAGASVLDRIESVTAVGPAAIEAEKNATVGGWSVRASFSNLASDLIYNLTGVCVWEGSPPPAGRLVFCETPAAILHPGDEWVGAWHLDPLAGSTPKYYPSANFTVVPHIGGTLVPLRELLHGGYEVSATVEEPGIECLPWAPVGEASLVFSKSVSPPVAEVGDVVTFTIMVRNEGTAPSGVLQVFDHLPAGLTYLDGTSSINGTLVEPTAAGNTLSWVLPPLTPGSQWVISFSAQVTAAPEGGVARNVVVYEGEEVAWAVLRVLPAPAPPPTSPTPPPVLNLPSLSIEKSCSPSTVTIGSTVSCTVRLINAGNGSAEDIALVDVLPDGLEYVSDSAIPEPESYSGGRLTWRIERLPPGGEFVASFLAVVTKGPPPGGAMINIAYARNLTASYRLTFAAPPRAPTVSKVGEYLGNQTISYLISVFSPEDIAELVVVDYTPEAAEIVEGSFKVSGVESWDFSISGSVLRLALRGLRGGSPATIGFQVTLPLGIAGDIVNTAELPEYDQRASSVVRIPPTLVTAALGGASVLPALAMLAIFGRGFLRRGAVLLDLGSMWTALLSGSLDYVTAGRRKILITYETAIESLESPLLRPAISDLIKRGVLDIVVTDERHAVSALLLSRLMGLSPKAALDIVAALSSGVVEVALSDPQAVTIARGLGLEVIFVPPALPVGGEAT